MRSVALAVVALVATVLSGCVPAPARGDSGSRLEQLDLALNALDAGRSAEARRLLQPLADDGSAMAETLLGGLHARGLGGRRDAPAAVAYWWRAAQRGYAPAQLALAQALAEGNGAPASPEAAYRWALLAARSGDDAVKASADRMRVTLARRIGARAAGRISERADAFRPWSPVEP